jgi:serine/threonine protein kinase
MMAAKQVTISTNNNSQEYYQPPPSVEAIKFEIELLKTLDHPNIIRFLGFHETPEHITM